MARRHRGQADDPSLGDRSRPCDDQERFFVLAFFDDAEAAEANSKLPETGEFADKQMALLRGNPTFTNLDVVKEITY